MCEIEKKITGIEFLQFGNFHFFLVKRNLLQFCLFLLLCAIKRCFLKNYGVTGLLLKIEVIYCKKWVKFIAMQKGSAAEYAYKVQWRVTLKYSTAIQKSTGPSPKYCSINLKKMFSATIVRKRIYRSATFFV